MFIIVHRLFGHYKTGIIWLFLFRFCRFLYSGFESIFMDFVRFSNFMMMPLHRLTHESFFIVTSPLTMIKLLGASIHNYGEDAVQIWTGRKHTEVLMAQFGNVSIFLLARCHRKILQSNIVLGVIFVASRILI
jgi:hypothetical protein